MGERKPQCAANVFGPRVQHWQCTRSGKVQRDGKWYCATHDPEAKKERAERESRLNSEREARDKATHERGKALLSRLGVDGGVETARWRGVNDPLYRECIVISFGEAERLLQSIKVDGR